MINTIKFRLEDIWYGILLSKDDVFNNKVNIEDVQSSQKMCERDLIWSFELSLYVMHVFYPYNKKHQKVNICHFLYLSKMFTRIFICRPKD